MLPLLLTLTRSMPAEADIGVMMIAPAEREAQALAALPAFPREPAGALPAEADARHGFRPEAPVLLQDGADGWGVLG